MKTKIGISLVCALAIGTTNAQDLAVGNVSAGIDSYNETTGEISDIYFDILNNESDDVDDFRIAIFVVDPDDFSNHYEIHSISKDGQYGNTVVNYSNIDVNINDTPNIPAGDYRILVCVDEDDDIFESNEDNNCLYITMPGDDITYTPSVGETSSVDEQTEISLELYPNPTHNTLTVKTTLNESALFEIVDLNGKVIVTKQMSATTTIDISDLQNGLYMYRLIKKEGTLLSTGRFTKS